MHELPLHITVGAGESMSVIAIAFVRHGLEGTGDVSRVMRHVPLSPLHSVVSESHFGSEPTFLLRLHPRTAHAVLTKLGYLIDNPRSNVLDRANAAGSVLADVLMQRHRGFPRVECRRRRLFAVPSPSLALSCGHSLPVPFSSGSFSPTK